MTQRTSLSIGDIVKITLPFPKASPQTFIASIVAIQTGGTYDDGLPRGGIFHLSVPVTSMRLYDGGTVDIRRCYLDEDGRFCYEFLDEREWVYCDEIIDLETINKASNVI